MPGAAPFPASEPNPAERYAASRRRLLSPQLTEFAAAYPFGLDDFQREGCEAIEAGEGVLVAAPTGAGKTVVGEFAVFLALAAGRKCFYTTPIKALSNQKFHDLVARHGEENVGLLTGDTTIRGEAPIVVMTTEVLRNMLYAGSATLAGLGFVVMDEVHYLSDRFRGAVWEEVIIHLAEDVQVVSLSATVSNAEEFGAWLAEVRGGTRIVVTEHRPVPLWQHVLAGPRMYDLFAPPPAPPSTVNPALTRLAREEIRRPPPPRGPRDRQRPRPGLFRPPSRADVITALDLQGMLPAITFIFSRTGCDAAVRQCVHAGVRLTTPEERTEIRRLVDERTTDLPDADLRVLGYWEWLEALERGVAAHHAGLLPLFKTVVEELFSRGLVRAVFATETLALGINMPARTVVLESLSKWNGETHADITPGEYTQLTGRAGRRGIDVEGHAVVLWRPGFDPRQVGGLASARTYPLRSSFRPSYNMAVNLVAQVGRGDARTLLEQSFAQFQADRSVVGLARQVTRADEALAGYLESAHCDKGDIREYDALRRALSAREADVARTRSAAGRAAAAHALESLRPGDVINVAQGRRAGVAVVLASGDPGPTVLTGDRHVRRLTPIEVPTAPDVLGRIRIPKSFQPRSPQARRDLVATLRAQGYLDRVVATPRNREQGPDAEITRLRAAMRAHPAHGCADRANHLRWLVRAQTLERETDSLRRRVESRTGSVAKVFDQVCAVLSDLRYLDGDQVTASGHPLAKIYNESDLVVAECVRQGRWEGLDPATLASVVSAVVYEARRDDAASPPPPNSARDALRATEEIYNELAALEAEHRLTTLRAPDSGLARAIHAWASGAPLESVLGDGDLLPGDFVRWCKQVVDLLGQIAAIPGHQVADTARKAARLLDRGVVSYA